MSRCARAHPQGHRRADREVFDFVARRVEQLHRLERRLAGARLGGDEFFLALDVDRGVLLLRDQRVVVVEDLLRIAVQQHPPALEQDRPVAHRLDRRRVVGNDQQRGAGVAVFADALEALVDEVGVAHRQRFVDDQQVRPHRGGDAEGHAHLHAAGIGAHRLVEVLTDLGEALDVGHQPRDRGLVVAHQAGGVEGVLAAGQVRVEAHAQLEDRRDPAARSHAALGRARGAGDQLQQRALAGAVLADDAHALAGVDAEVHVPQHPVLLGRGHRNAKPGQHPQPFAAPAPVGLAQRAHMQFAAHSTSTISGLALRNRNSARIATPTATSAIQPSSVHSGGLLNTSTFW